MTFQIFKIDYIVHYKFYFLFGGFLNMVMPHIKNMMQLEKKSQKRMVLLKKEKWYYESFI